MARYLRVCDLVGLLLLIFSTTASSALKCPDRRQISPGQQITCYTSSNEVARLEDAICRCTTIVHQGYDLWSLDASGLRSLQNTAKEANPHLKVVISISDKHELFKNSATTLHEVATNLTEIIKEVDGVELNITADNKERLVSFIKDLKDKMSNKSLEKVILLELPTKPEDLAKQFELKELSKYVDVFTVSTHYLKDNDETYRTFHPSRLMGLFDMLNTDSLVDLISGIGVPKHKILISVPANAYKFTLKNSDNNTPRSLTVEEEPLPLDRKKLCDTMSVGEWTVERDADLTAPYAFKNTTWIAFEDEISLKIKGKYVILRDLAGLGLRDVENDLKNSCGMSLTQSIYQAFRDMKRKSREVVLSSLEKDLKSSEIAYSRHVRSSNFRILRVVDTEGKIRAIRENTQTAFTCTRQGYFVHPKSCNRFYRCVKFNQDTDDYSVFEFDCPAGLAFDERTEVCVWPGSVSKGSACPGSSEIEPVPRSRFRCPSQPGFYADPQNCRWFFACYDLGGSEMVPYEFRCPFGLIFDENRLICEWPWKVASCNSPKHNNRYNSYAYDNNYEAQKGYTLQEGIISQSGFIGQAGYPGSTYGEGSYNGQNYNATRIKSGFNRQIYNGTGSFGSEAEHEWQNYDEHSFIAKDAKYDKKNYNVAETSGVREEYDAHSYNAHTIGTKINYDEKNYKVNNSVKPTVGFDGQTYNPVRVSEDGVEYGHNYNLNDATRTDIHYNGNTYNQNDLLKPLVGLYGQTYNPSGAAEVEIEYQRHKYDAPNLTGTVENYDGKIYNTNEAMKPAKGHGEPTYYPIRTPETGVGYNEYNYNVEGTTGTGVNYDGKMYNTDGVVNLAVEYDRQTYNPIKSSKGNVGFGYNYNAYDATGSGINYGGNIHNINNFFKSMIGHDEQTYYSHRAPETADDSVEAEIGYNDQRYNGFKHAGSGFQQSPFNAYGYEGQHVNVAGDRGSAVNHGNQASIPETGVNYEQNVEYPRIGNNNPMYINPGIVYGNKINTNGYNYQNVNIGNEDHVRDGTTKSSDCDNQSGTHINYDGKKDSTYSDNKGSKTTSFNSRGSVTTVGINNFNKNTHAPTGYIEGLTNIAGRSGLTTGYVPRNTNGHSQNTVTGYTDRTTNGNAVHISIEHTPYTSGVITHNGLTTNQFGNINFTKSLEAQTVKTDQLGHTNSIITIGNMQYSSDISGPIMYNTSYNIGSGFPITTIIPFATRDNTINSVGSEGTTPINYMGLTSTEHFGIEYNNQARKSFTNPGQAPTNFASHRPTESTPYFNSKTNVYDYSKVNIDDVTPVITIIRDGHPGNSEGLTRVTNTSDPKLTTTNYNYDMRLTNLMSNSPFIGSSITSTNNDITNFHKPTKLPSSFKIVQGITSISGSTIPTVVPFSNALSEIELDNSGLFKIGASTTPATKIQTSNKPSTIIQNNGYRTNEYYDNGGRGTIRYNNGLIASKVTENDIQDFRKSAYTRLPNSFIISASNGENEQSTVQNAPTDANQQHTAGTFTKEGFTKTGPTKTGITTAQVGGSGSYVIGTGSTRIKPNTQYIGEQAFAVNFDTSESTTKIGTTPSTNNFNNNELLKFDTVSEIPNKIAGYSYSRPLIEVEVKGASNMSNKTQTMYFTVPTPSPNIQLINNHNSPIIKTNAQNNKDFSTNMENGIPLQTTSSVHTEENADFGTVISSTPTSITTNTQKQRYQTNNLSIKPNTYLNVDVSFDQERDYISSIQGSTGSSDYSDITTNFDQSNFGHKIPGQRVLTNINYQQPTINTHVVNKNNELIISTQDRYNFYTQTGEHTMTQRGPIHPNRLTDSFTTVNLTSTTIAPVIDITVRKPIVAVELSQDQFNYPSTAEILQNTNSVNIAPQRSHYRTFTNQASVEFPQQRTANRILINQASRDHGSAYRGPSNKILNNEASENSSSQKLNNRILNNQISANFVSQVSPSRVLNNQNIKDFRPPPNEIVSNLEFENSYSGQNQGFSGQTRTLIGSNVITSIDRTTINNGWIPENRENLKIISEFNSVSNRNLGLIQQSTTTSPTVTTYTGDFNKSSNFSNAFANERNNNKKVIVKLSDLHPLILGKLSAECTCKADPFAIFRGSNKQALPIKFQNHGHVDLANYDEDDIYVDIDNDEENVRNIELIKNIPPNIFLKTSKLKTNYNESERNTNIKSSEESPSTYLPPTRTSILPTYLPSTRLSNAYLTSTTEAPITPMYRKNQASLSIRTKNHQPLRVKDDNINNALITTSQRRSSKTLFDQTVKTSNNIKGLDATFDRSKSQSFSDNSLQNNLECARPGLFRHPTFCNKFYACHWDNWKKRYTLHIFNCPVHLAFDFSAGACNYPSKGPACQDNKLLV